MPVYDESNKKIPFCEEKTDSESQYKEVGEYNIYNDILNDVEKDMEEYKSQEEEKPSRICSDICRIF